MLSRKEFFKIFCNSKPYLSNTSIFFEELNLSALDEFHEYSIDERIYEYLEFKPFKNEEDSKQYLCKLIDRMKKNGIERNASYWFIREKKENLLVGTAGLVNLDLNRQSVELGFGINPNLWGRGFIMEIIETLKKFTFSELCLNRLHGKTMINNERTIQSVLAAGMSKEGIAKDYYYKDSRFIDAFYYGMTKSSYLSAQNLELKIENNISQQDVLSAVNSVFDNNSLDLESSMENTIEWDSMNHMFVMLALKEKLNVELSPNQIMQATSIKKILEILN